MKKYVSLFLIISFLLPSACFASLDQPETIEEGKQMMEEGAKRTIEFMPGFIRDVIKNEVLPIWEGLWSWVRNVFKKYIKDSLVNLWYNEIKPGVKSILNSTKRIFGGEIKEREDVFKEEFDKEKEELKEELPGATKSLWQRFKDLF